MMVKPRRCCRAVACGRVGVEPDRKPGVWDMMLASMFPTDYAIAPHDLAVAAEARGYDSCRCRSTVTFPPVANRRGPAAPSCRILSRYLRSVPLAGRCRRGDENHQACDGDLSCRRARSNPHRQGGIDRRPAFLGPVHFGVGGGWNEEEMAITALRLQPASS